MNRTVPPRDRGDQVADPLRASGPAGSLPGAERLIGRTEVVAGRRHTKSRPFASLNAFFAKDGPMVRLGRGGRKRGLPCGNVGLLGRFRLPTPDAGFGVASLQMVAGDSR